MRLTVGPLPPAVYWRRRALVLGCLVAVIVLLVYSCGDSGGSNANPRGADGGSSAPPDGGAAGTQSTQGDASSSSAASTGAAPTGAAPAADPPSPSAAASPTAAPDPSLCTDAELTVTPVPAARQLARGVSTQIVLKIKNKSNRTCRRDVGADLLELYIVEQGGAEKIWSSDDCGGPRGTSVESFTPGFERSYTAVWNGRESTNCKDRPLPAAGEYQLYGRLGTKRSDPVKLTLT
jgi:hypothetical protein